MAWLSLKRAADKAGSLWRAVWSVVRYGEVTLRTYTLRKAECFDCDQIVSKERGLFCGACGCPPSYLSDLRTKWRMPDVQCPLKKW